MRHWINYHMIAFFMGFLLDLVLGDPYYLPHPIRLIGKLIARTEKNASWNWDKRGKIVRQIVMGERFDRE